MGGQTPNQAWRYPYLGEPFVRQSIEDLADDVDASLETWDAKRQFAVVREQGAARRNSPTSTSVTATVGTNAYLVFEEPTYGTGQPITMSQFTLHTGLYRVDLSAQKGAVTGSITSVEIAIELDGTAWVRRKLPPAAGTYRVAGPVYVSAATGTLRARVFLNGTSGSTLAFINPRIGFARVAR